MRTVGPGIQPWSQGLQTPPPNNPVLQETEGPTGLECKGPVRSTSLAQILCSNLDLLQWQHCHRAGARGLIHALISVTTEWNLFLS